MSSTSIEKALTAMFSGCQYVQGRGLLPRLQKMTGFSLLETKQEVRRLAREGYLAGITMAGDAEGRVTLLKPLSIERDPRYVQWESILKDYEKDLTFSQKDALAKASPPVLSLNPADQAALIEGLISLSCTVMNGTSTDTYITSAKYLLSSSKALDILGTQIASAFGITPESSLNRIQHVLTAGPDEGQTDTVLFIENMATFSAFAVSETRNKALAICSFGYGLSMDKLGERLKFGKLRSCPAVGPRYDLAKALSSAKRVLFWGDLDKEGLRIYASLRSSIPKIELSAAYILMEAELCRGNSHPYGPFASKSMDQREANLNDPAMQPLLRAVKDRAVDQEAVCEPWPGDIILETYEPVVE